MKLQDLNKTIQSNLLTSTLLKSNLSSDLIIVEAKNLGIANTLQSLTINNSPITDCWLFEHEDSEKEFLTTAKKVEKTIIFLSKDTKELFLIFIEMKSHFQIKQLLDCETKLNASLTHLSIFLATNNHMTDIYKDYKIKFRMAIFCNQETILSTHPSYTLPLCQDYVSFKNGSQKRFNINISSPSLGPIIVPSTRILEVNNEHISISFDDLISKLKN